jgi:hypothetical protein
MSALDRLKLLGDRADPLTRWQAEAEVKAETEARERQSAQRQAAESREVAALRAEIAGLRASFAERAERDGKILKAIDDLATCLDKIEGWVRKQIETRILRSQGEMAGRIAESFGELRGLIAAIDPAQARAAKGEAFRFASEKGAGESDGEPIELPNWRRGNGTVVN